MILAKSIRLLSAWYKSLDYTNWIIRLLVWLYVDKGTSFRIESSTVSARKVSRVVLPTVSGLRKGVKVIQDYYTIQL